MVESDVTALNDMSVKELKILWQQYFNSEPVWKTKRFYVPRLAYRMQELAYGGLPNNVRQLLLNTKFNVRSVIPRNEALPVPGTRIIKNYLGKEYNVIVTPSGFQFEGKYYKSLSAIAFVITGKRISGNFFFKIGAAK